MTKRGTVEIPKPLRDDLALHAGDVLRIAAGGDGQIVISKQPQRTRSWLKVLRACPAALPALSREHFAERDCAL